MAIRVVKLNLFPLGDKEEINRVYNFVRNGMRVHSLMLNKCMSAMYSFYLENNLTYFSHIKENNLTDEYKELKNKYKRLPNSSKGSAYDNMDIVTPQGIILNIPRTCESAFKKACNDGLMLGKVSLPTYKSDSPMPIQNDLLNVKGYEKTVVSVVKDEKGNPLLDKDGNKITVNKQKKYTKGFYYSYDNYAEFYDNLMNNPNPNLFIDLCNDIKVKVVLGSVRKSLETRKTIEKIFTGEYKVCDSEITIKGTKIMLYLTLDVGEIKHTLDENKVVGVDIGLAIPCVCALNDNYYKREYIGNYNDFCGQRVKLQAQRKEVQRNIKYAKGGHGRKRKLKKLDNLQNRERNLVHNLNHQFSKRVVDFAIKNNAGVIKMENLKGFGKNNKEKHKFVLRNWSYYELQSMIENKALANGIKVKYINPAFTSQTCSVCGKLGTRPTQDTFICSDPNCKVHTMYNKSKTKRINADFNGARNIAMSEEYRKD